MSASDSPDSDSDVDVGVEKMRQQAAQRERDRQVEKVENLGTKQWLQSELEEQAKPVDVLGRKFMFRPISSERVEEALELASEEAQKTSGVDADSLDEVDPEEMQDMPKLLRVMRETLAEHCLDEEMDEEAFGILPVNHLEEVFQEVAMAGNSMQPR